MKDILKYFTAGLHAAGPQIRKSLDQEGLEPSTFSLRD